MRSHHSRAFGRKKTAGADADDCEDVNAPTHILVKHSSNGGRIRFPYPATYRGFTGEILDSIIANGLRAGGLNGVEEIC